ncbi:hypothetical protein B0H14DRAFT_2624904 [Mycena olivaceomarginata]|nr:hypothetical protein B0H14DRAFT_2624904 [Mycena olivaceomarginata]
MTNNDSWHAREQLAFGFDHLVKVAFGQGRRRTGMEHTGGSICLLNLMSTGSSPALECLASVRLPGLPPEEDAPPKISSSQYVDDKAEHDSDGSNGEETSTNTSSDFIDDTVQEGNLSNGKTHHPPVVDDTEDSDGDAASNTEERPARINGAVKKKCCWGFRVSEQIQNFPTSPNGQNTGAPIPVNSDGAVLNTIRIIKALNGPSVPGINLVMFCLGMDPGNTQGFLEVVRTSAGPVKIRNAPAIIFRISGRKVSQCVPGQTTALSFRSGDRRNVLFRRGPLLPPSVTLWLQISDIFIPRGFHDAVDDETLSLNKLVTPTATEGYRKSPQNGSPAKKRKEEEPELHTIDVKTCSTLPDVCEVMDVAIQDPMMKPIYAAPVASPQEMPSHYVEFQRGAGNVRVKLLSRNQPEVVYRVRASTLSYCHVAYPCSQCSTVWALLLFVRKSVYINPARVDPRLLQARSPHYIKDGPKKRHLHMSALTVRHQGIPIEQYENLETKVQPGVKSSGNIYKKNTYVPSNGLP